MKITPFKIIPIAFGISMCLTLQAVPNEGAHWEDFTISEADGNGDITITVNGNTFGLANNWVNKTVILEGGHPIYKGNLKGAVEAFKKLNNVETIVGTSSFKIKKLTYGWYGPGSSAVMAYIFVK